MRVFTRMLVVVAALSMVGCDEKLSDLTGPTPDLKPTFSSIQHNIFEAPDSSGRVACTGCHNGTLLRGGLDLSAGISYASLVNVSSREKPGLMRIAPGDPENSYLIHKVEGRSGIVGLRMPFSGPPFLTDGQIRVIKRWIEEGAKSD